jgi:hypothetical protein
LSTAASRPKGVLEETVGSALQEWLRVLKSDADFLFYSWSLADLAIPIAIVFWGLILMIPMTGVDRRDINAFGSYVVYSVFGAILLIIVLPYQYVDTSSLGMQIATAILVTTATGFRWFARNKATPRISDTVLSLGQSNGEEKRKKK